MSAPQIVEWVSAAASTAGALGTVGLVIVAWRTLGGAREQLRLFQQQVAREGRPYVVAEVVPGLHGAAFSDLIVTNTGRTLAHRLTVDIGKCEKQNDDDHISEALSKYLVTPRTLAPGSRHRLMWRAEPNDESGRLAAGPPRSGVIGRVSYTDDLGTEYCEEYDLSIDTMIGAMPVPSEGAKVHGRASKAETDLANIDRALRTMNAHIGEIRR